LQEKTNYTDVVEANDFSMTLWFSVFDDQEVSEKGDSPYTNIINGRSFATNIFSCNNDLRIARLHIYI
jgi:hypothetical protein